MRPSTLLLAQFVAALSGRARCWASMGRRPASLLIVVTLCLQPTSQAWTHPEPDFSILADRQRLEWVKNGCRAISADLRSSSATPYQSEGLHILYECLIQAAVEEFRNHIATEYFTTDDFETRLRRLTDEEAQLIVDINIKHGRDFPPGTMWGPIGVAIRVGLAEDYLDAIWRYYKNSCPASRC